MSTPPDGEPLVPPPPPRPAAPPLPSYDPYAPSQQHFGPYPVVPPPPPPPRHSLAPLTIIAINVAGVVVLCLALIWMLNAFQSQPAIPAQSAVLTVPNTLVEGKYTLGKDLSGSLQQEYNDPAAGADRLTAVGGEYNAVSGATLDMVTFWGGYGHIGSPTLFRVGLLAGMGLPPGIQRAIAPQEFTPAGTDQTVSCEVLTMTRDGATITMPVCVWDDSSVAITVSHTTPAIVYQGPSAVDLQSLADLTGQVLDEVRSAARSWTPPPPAPGTVGPNA